MGSWVLTFLACAEPEPVVFPAGVEPLEDNEAPYPPGGGYPELLCLVIDDTDELDRVHGRAYMHHDVELVWEAFQEPEVVVDRREVSEWSVEHDIDDSVDVSFVLHETIDNIIDFDMDIEWRQSLVQADEWGAPEVVGLRFEKTEGGEVIEVMAGSVTLEQVEEGVTALSYVYWLQSLTGEVDPAVSYVTDLHASVAAWTAGEPLPSYDDED